jgi:hypothetical protein
MSHVGSTGANVTPRVNSGHANEVESRPKNALDGATLILGSPGVAAAHPRGLLRMT